MGKFGLDTSGPEFEDTTCLWASVDWQKGKAGMHEGALDSYGVVLVRTRWTNQVNERSRMVYEGRTYQIIPETFHADRQENTVQFMAQVIINDKQLCICNVVHKYLLIVNLYFQYNYNAKT